MNRTKLAKWAGISAICAGIWMGKCSYDMGKKVDAAQAVLHQQPDYCEAERVRQLSEALGTAQSHLTYREEYTERTSRTTYVKHVTKYPNGALAHATLDHALKSLGECGTVDDALRAVRDDVPLSAEIQTYNGIRADSNAFGAERAVIGNARDSLNVLRDASLEKVKDFVDAERKAHNVQGLYLLGLLTSIMVAGFAWQYVQENSK
ncbi:hypothetical protein HY642_05160 [Candidatus Woesearchaeota archaeon]|nr:hypothetical protein [Candidatus Woesearchaeota archaeon]